VLAGWLLAAAAGSVMLTQAVGWNGFTQVAALQALTPYVLVGLVPLAGVACWAHADRLAVVAALAGVGGLVLAAPVVFTPDQPAPDPTAAGVTVAAVNLLYRNPVISQAADSLLEQRSDVIVFSEYTVDHQTELNAHPLAEQFPHKVDSVRPFAGGLAVWSRYPLIAGEELDTINVALDLTVTSPDGPLRLLGVHPPTPIFDHSGWIADLTTFGEVTSDADDPTLIIGDLNASRWHPVFRDLLGRGFVSAHEAHGRGFSTSWPTDEFIPAFVRLDHALTGNGLVSTAIEDFTVPGSDHRGLVVTVAPAG